MLGFTFFKYGKFIVLLAVFVFSIQLKAGVEVEENNLRLSVDSNCQGRFKKQGFCFDIKFSDGYESNNFSEAIVGFLKGCRDLGKNCFHVYNSELIFDCDDEISLFFCGNMEGRWIFRIIVPRTSQLANDCDDILEAARKIIDAIEMEIHIKQKCDVAGVKEKLFSVWDQCTEKTEVKSCHSSDMAAVNVSKIERKGGEKRKNNSKSSADVPKAKNPRLSVRKKSSDTPRRHDREKSARQYRVTKRKELPCPRSLKFSDRVNLSAIAYWVESDECEDLVLKACDNPTVTFPVVSPVFLSGQIKLSENDVPDTMSRNDFNMFSNLGRALKRSGDKAQFIAGKGKYYPWVISQVKQIVSGQDIISGPKKSDARFRSDLLDWAFENTGFDWRRIPLEKRLKKGWDWCMPWMSRQLFGQYPALMALQYYNFKQRDDRELLTDFDFYCACPEAYIWLLNFSGCSDFTAYGICEEQYLHICDHLDKAVEDSDVRNIIWNNLTRIEMKEERLNQEGVSDFLWS